MISENNLRSFFSLLPSYHPTLSSMSATQYDKKLSWGNSVWGKNRECGCSGEWLWAEAVKVMTLKRH